MRVFSFYRLIFCFALLLLFFTVFFIFTRVCSYQVFHFFLFMRPILERSSVNLVTSV